MTISRQKAIWQQCHQCVASDKKNNWVKDVEGCRGYTCCLYHLRPVRGTRGNPVEAHKLPLHLKHWRSEIAESVGCSTLLSIETSSEITNSSQTETNKPAIMPPTNLCSIPANEVHTS